MKINLLTLKMAMESDLHRLVDVLEEYGFKLPRIKMDYIQCGFDDTSSGNSIIIKHSDIKILSYKRYSDGSCGDIIDLFLLKEPNNKIYGELLDRFKDLYNELNGDEAADAVVSSIKKSYLEYITSHEIKPNEYEILPDNLIGEPCISWMLMKDRIRPSIQLEFGIWEHKNTERICFNWKDISGNFIGASGRFNGTSFINKYMSIYDNFKKTLHLYGLYENLKYIIKAKKVYIFESEKSVLQTASNNHRLSIATGYSNISANQLELLKYLGVETIIFCPDEDIDINEHVKTLKKNINLNGFDFDIKYIIDINKKYLGYKMSPADLNNESYCEFIKMCEISYEDLIKNIKE